jgi:hypothetical protein
MKTNRKSIKSSFLPAGKAIVILILAGSLFTTISCKKSESPNVTFKAVINGASETPPNSSTATGTATLNYDKNTRIFSVVVEYTGITPIAAHIHKGDVGVAGNVIFGFNPPLTSPINYTSPALDSAQNADLLSDKYYVNLHSTAFPAGEIRGQLILQ